jgi:LacI family transcriptional regulator
MATKKRTSSGPRLSDIAEKAGVSVPTVSLALADHPRISLRTKRLVWRISEEVGYRKARGRGPRALQQPTPGIRRIGLLVTGGRHDDPVMSGLMMCLTAAASRLKLTVEMACLTDPDRASERVQRSAEFAAGQDGLIVTGHIDAAMVAALEKLDVPFVVLGSPVGHVTCECVTYDSEDAGSISTGALIRQGHTRIGYLSESMPAGGATHRWHRGHLLALIEAGLTPQAALTQTLDPQRDAVAPVLEGLFKNGGAPTALVVPNPFLAQSVLGWFHQCGRQVPVHTLEIKEMLLPAIRELPAVIISIEQLAEFALRRLLELSFRHPSLPLLTLVPFELRDLAAP